jgi:histidinol-phosphate aminotransferase
VDAGRLERFLDAVPSSCTVVLDEAYREFVDDPDSLDGLRAADGRDNVVVLRTFSKAHGLAGLRVGYGVAPRPIADAVRAVALPFTLSIVAEAAAIAALDSWATQELVVKDVIARRADFAADLTACGLEVPTSQANFVWLPASGPVRGLAAALAEVGPQGGTGRKRHAWPLVGRPTLAPSRRPDQAVFSARENRPWPPSARRA